MNKKYDNIFSTALTDTKAYGSYFKKLNRFSLTLLFLTPKNVTYTVPTKQKPPKQSINQKLEKKIMPQETKEKSPQRQSSQLRTQLRKYYKIFNPQPKILTKVVF